MAEKEPVIVTLFGRAKAVLISYQFYEDMLDKPAIHEGREQSRCLLQEFKARPERSDHE